MDLHVNNPTLGETSFVVEMEGELM